MKKLNQNGYVEDFGFVVIVVLIFMFFASLFFVRWEWSEDNVSGIVYNTQNNKAISGNTSFAIRAGENTPVTEENKSTYCLPPNSQYKDLVNKAAGDKRVKVQVTTKKGFWLKAPWTCVDNVVVTEVK